MQFIPIKTRPLCPPKDNLIEVMDKCITHLEDGDLLFITSKVVAIHEGNCVKNDGSILKKDLIRSEADCFLKTDIVPGKDIYLTLKNNILIPSAGIDESNANGYFVLWPKKMEEFCLEIHKHFTKKFDIKNLGIIITDSTTRIGKWGVVGIGIYSYGVIPLNDERGKEDIFGKKLEFTQINLIDALSAMAVYLMGEGSETQPIIIGRNIPGVKYSLEKGLYEKTVIHPKNDLYGVLLEPLIDVQNK